VEERQNLVPITASTDFNLNSILADTIRQNRASLSHHLTVTFSSKILLGIEFLHCTLCYFVVVGCHHSLA
jgi:hypothetical protein